MSNIVLTAGVRQNLLSLQNTADLMSITQNRLATGKKVNTALDNPSSYFTSQALGDRAGDLNSLLDAVGQGQKVIEQANLGITSLTKMVQNAKALTQQARQAPKPVTTYLPVSQNSDISSIGNLGGSEAIATTSSATFGGNTVSYSPVAKTIAAATATFTETLGQVQGTDNTPVNSAVGNLVINVAGTDYTIALGAGDTGAALLTKINNVVGAAGANLVEATYAGTGELQLTAINSSVDFTISNTSTAQVLTDLGITGGAAGTSTSLLDHVGAGKTLSFTGTIGTTTVSKTVTIGTGGPATGQVKSLAELSTWVNNNLSVLGSTAQLNVTNPAAGGTSVTGSFSLEMAAGLTNTVTVAGDATFSDSFKPGGISGTYNSAPTFLDLGNAKGYDFTNGGNITINVNGSVQTVGLSSGDRLADIINKLKSNATLDNNLVFADDGAGHLQITAKNADVDFAISPNTVSNALGLTQDAVTTNDCPSTSLLDLLNAKLGGTAAGQTLTIAVNGGTAQTLTFGNDPTQPNQVSTMAEFKTALATLSGISATLAGSVLNFNVPSNTSQTSLTVSGSNNGAIAAAFGLTVGNQTGAASPTQDNATRTSLQNDYNGVLVQIDNLVKDSSYNGINLLFSDELKIIFNENGSSSLTITGVKFDASGLGLAPVNGSNGAGFQDDSIVDATLTKLEAALGNLRSQASRFGSNLSTVQTRQDFTKNLINTLQTGADNLVLADTNEEGANMLALQTRQQLSTTALSLANQASQAVLRLFG